MSALQAEREEVRFVSGGEHCAGRLFRPAGSGRSPCVVLGTGLGCVRDQGLDRYGERFAAAGFTALAFDYRHFGDSEGEPRTLLSPRLQRQDLRAALAYARGLDSVDSGRIAIWGYSLGGAHAQAVTIGDPEIAAAIYVAPVIDSLRSLLHMGGPPHLARVMAAGIRDRIRGLRRSEPVRLAAAGPPGSGAVMCTWDAARGFEEVTEPGSSWRNDLCPRGVTEPPYRLERRARRIHRPALYCIAADDEVNPPSLGERTARGASSAELRLYPGGHLAPFQGETFERMAADQVAFLERRL
jgi:pimeloyl-ACP methyl ester carboxylesterase